MYIVERMRERCDSLWEGKFQIGPSGEWVTIAFTHTINFYPRQNFQTVVDRLK